MHKKGLTVFLSLLFLMCMGSVALAAPSTYVVQAGDSLWKIAQKTGLSVDQIKQINSMKSDNLNIGQSLNLLSKTVMPSGQNNQSVANTNVYLVASGDNLWSIANKFGTSVEKIKQLNNLSSERLQIGDRLLIDGTIPVPAPAVTVPKVPVLADANTSVSRSGDDVAASRIVESAGQYLGTPYRYGGSGPGGFDCSGFSSYIYGQAGINLPRTAAEQSTAGVRVEKADLLPGDLLFFCCYGGGIDHVGIYCGDGKFIHSSSPRSGGVIYSYLSEAYYANSYACASRVLR